MTALLFRVSLTDQGFESFASGAQLRGLHHHLAQRIENSDLQHVPILLAHTGQGND
jgi:hypothetical protein